MSSMNSTPSANRLHIGFFGRRNAGKSSVVNAVTGQEMAVVSDYKGTTTDPVQKAMELLPLGPVVIIDTPGIDDEGTLGEMRVKRTRQILNRADLAVLVVDGTEGMTDCDRELIAIFEEKEIPYVIAWNKKDRVEMPAEPGKNGIWVSALTGEGIHELKVQLGKLAKEEESDRRIAADLLQPGDMVILVTPIDEAAPRGRLILPQQQTIRDVLDAHAMCIVTRETELEAALKSLAAPPAMVITDSQAFAHVGKVTPESIPLTSFSILMARYKGLLEAAVRGAAAVETLRDGDTVLIAEGCTHHRQCDDIGTVKIPGWLRIYTGKDIAIRTCSGTEFPDDLSPYAMVIHCGGCMLNEREVRYRTKCAVDQGVPITNYGTLIAYLNGILARSTELFPEL